MVIVRDRPLWGDLHERASIRNWPEAGIGTAWRRTLVASIQLSMSRGFANEASPLKRLPSRRYVVNGSGRSIWYGLIEIPGEKVVLQMWDATTVNLDYFWTEVVRERECAPEPAGAGGCLAFGRSVIGRHARLGRVS